MTVKDLIIRLLDKPLDSDVYIYDSNDGNETERELHSVEIVSKYGDTYIELQ